MKKFCSLFICLFTMSMTGFSLPNSSVLLQHKGNVTVYQSESLNEVLENAVDGDTLFLSKGTYPGFTVDKKITVRGEGAGNTIISGLITVSIPDSVTLSSTVLEGLYLKGYYNGTDDNYSIRVTTPLNGFKIKQCDFETLVFDRTMNNVVIDRCYCSKYISIPNKVRSLRAVNSKLYNVKFAHPSSFYSEESSKDITFINCNVRTFNDFESFRGTLINSITGYGRSGSQVSFKSCSFINTLVCTYRLTIDGTCYQENCWSDNSSTKMLSDYMNCMYSDEELVNKGYVGNDGTVIGCNGGATPYTLTLSVPVVTSADVKLDAGQRKLNVNITLSAK